MTSGAASAHDLKGAIEDPTLQAHSAVSGDIPYADVQTRAVIWNAYLWPLEWRIKVCFMSGDAGLRADVVRVMKKWRLARYSEGNLAFDFGPSGHGYDCGFDASDISIGFAGAARRSAVGIASRQHRPSMVLGGLDTLPRDAEWERMILHETGHALGLHHEHQNPRAAGCEQDWNYDWIYATYAWESDEQMRANMGRLTDEILDNGSHAFSFLTYDRSSVMHYAFPAEAHLSGTSSPCFTTPNMVPSSQDLRALRTAYGNRARNARMQFRSALPALVNNTQLRLLRPILEEKARMLDQ